MPWQTAGVQYVIEASGMFTSLEKASVSLNSKHFFYVIGRFNFLVIGGRRADKSPDGCDSGGTRTVLELTTGQVAVLLI